MAGYRDESLAKRVELLLKSKEMAEASDRHVARVAGCSKYTVRVVRGRLIALGILPIPKPDPRSQSSTYGTKPVVVRGGYIMDPETGKIIPATKYYPRKKGGKK